MAFAAPLARRFSALEKELNRLKDGIDPANAWLVRQLFPGSTTRHRKHDLDEARAEVSLANRTLNHACDTLTVLNIEIQRFADGDIELQHLLNYFYVAMKQYNIARSNIADARLDVALASCLETEDGMPDLAHIDFVYVDHDNAVGVKMIDGTDFCELMTRRYIGQSGDILPVVALIEPGSMRDLEKESELTSRYYNRLHGVGVVIREDASGRKTKATKVS